MGQIEPTQQDKDINELRNWLATWDIPGQALDKVHDAARTSLQELKEFENHEDDKAARLLTIIAFLSAVVAAVFTRFASDFKVPPFSKFAVAWDWILPMATYACFIIYVVLVTWAVWMVVCAIGPVFRKPRSDPTVAGARPTSMVSYQGMLDAPALQWGKTFAA